jgi:hypothetical protein
MPSPVFFNGSAAIKLNHQPAFATDGGKSLQHREVFNKR